jgi:hypothetical protein
VTYTPSRQRRAIRSAIDAIVDSGVRNCRGDLQGPWAKSIAELHARIGAQYLIDLISSFKRREFRREDEWRIVCRPVWSTAGSAPDLDDDRFRPLIKNDNKRDRRYVELGVYEEGQVLGGFPRPTIPFCRVYVSGDPEERVSEQQGLREMLQDGARSGVDIRQG